MADELTTEPTVVTGTFPGTSRTFAIAVAPVDGHDRMVCAIRVGDSPELITAAQGAITDHATAAALAACTEIVENR